MMKFIVVLLSVGALFSLTACDDASEKKSTPKPRVVVKKTSAPIVSEVEAAVEEQKSIYRYVTTGRKDPFTSLLAVREPLQDDLEPLTPLQRFGVKELILTAVVSGKGQARAMVMAPDKKAYVLTVGIRVGRNQGYVKEITVDGVVVEESFRDFSGDVRTELKKITLPNREGE